MPNTRLTAAGEMTDTGSGNKGVASSAAAEAGIGTQHEKKEKEDK